MSNSIDNCLKRIAFLEQSIQEIVRENQGNTSLDITHKLSRLDSKLVEELLILNKLRQTPQPSGNCQLSLVLELN